MVMNLSRVLRDTVLLGVVFAGLLAVQANLVKNSLKEQDRQRTRRLQASVGVLVNAAHKSQDDLLVTQVITALSKLPGIVEVRLAEAKNGNKGTVRVLV